MAETTRSSKSVFKGTFLQVWQDEVTLQDGSSSIREYIKHPGASIIIAFNEKNELLLVEQFRYPLKRIFLELPAGKKDAGESPVDTARRELEEETGYRADSFEHLTDLHPCIGYADEVIHVVLAKNLRWVGAKLDHGEFLTVKSMSLDSVIEMIGKSEITDAKTSLAILWFHQFYRGKSSIPFLSK